MAFRRVLVLGAILFALNHFPGAASANQQAAQVSYPIEPITTSGGDYAVISADGRYVVFESNSGDLVPGQIAGSRDLYRYDRQAGKYERVSTRTDSSPAYNSGAYDSSPSISADGQRIAFLSDAALVDNDTNGLPDIYLRDFTTGQTELISSGLDGKPANGPSFNPVLSADGRFVVFQSQAANLVPGDSNSAIDIFLRDRVTATTELISITSSGEQGTDPHDYGYSSLGISADGQTIAFSYRSLPVSGSPTAQGEQVYLRDRDSRTTRRIAEGSLPALSAQGNILAFVTSAALILTDKNDAADLYLFDIPSGRFEPVTQAGAQDMTSPPALSLDGRFVAFQTSTALVAADTNGQPDIYLYDRSAGTFELISAPPGGQSDGASAFPAISANGQVIAFTSSAANLASADTNGRYDVFVSDRSAVGLIPETGPGGNMVIYLPAVRR